MLALFTGGLLAQSSITSGTGVYVHPGTSIEFVGNHSLSISSNTAFENDGIIQLMGDAVISESPGFPITGSGLERSSSRQVSSLVSLNPGGLGLTIDQSSPTDSLWIVRGHTPKTGNSGSQGVARWFQISAQQWSSTGELGFNLDNSELNGLTTNELVLHLSANGSIWTTIPGVFGTGNILTGTPIDSLGYFTLFSDTTTASVDESLTRQLRLYPNPVKDMLIIELLNGIPPHDVIVQDVRGNLVSAPVDILHDRINVDVSSLAKGAYSIWLEGARPRIFIKQ